MRCECDGTCGQHAGRCRYRRGERAYPGRDRIEMRLAYLGHERPARCCTVCVRTLRTPAGPAGAPTNMRIAEADAESRLPYPAD